MDQMLGKTFAPILRQMGVKVDFALRRPSSHTSKTLGLDRLNRRIEKESENDRYDEYSEDSEKLHLSY